MKHPARNDGKMNIIREINRTGKRGEMLRFVLVGGFCTLLQYGFYVLFVHVAGISVLASTVISYLLSLVANFFLSSLFTFRSGPTVRNGLGFALSHLINLGMQTGLVAVFKGLNGATYALLPALAICVPLNFLLVRYAFRSRLFGNRKKETISESIGGKSIIEHNP